HRCREPAMYRVVTSQVRVGRGIAEIVDRDNLDLRRSAGLVNGAQDVASDAAIAVDCHSCRHAAFLVLLCGLFWRRPPVTAAMSPAARARSESDAWCARDP